MYRSQKIDLIGTTASMELSSLLIIDGNRIKKPDLKEKV